ncbi:peroxiredoxin [Pseudofrankia asymbiotica]|uniref:thioredoxin-dependent peroxiredoxin n=1 Tax=Pseudofrankia asymbiotica TaxID=1834516 RepID=A0A1V2I2M1_9ACTN|nr:peroxiredoxin [Pseudofrankia asymbiotica]ONH24515.1 peroxiredoxin [Pseudofrankia asymbiotica]
MNVGDRIEDLSGVDETGATLRLSDLLAKGPLVVFFYPAAMTYGCTKESCHFRDLADEFAGVGAGLVGISADDIEKQAAFSAKHSFGFPLIADTDRKIAEAFGVRRKRGPNKRATFVLSADGVVLARIESEFAMNRHADEALEALRSAAK